MTTDILSPRLSQNYSVTILRAATCAAFLLLAALHLLRPELNPSWVFISDYMLGAWGWLMRLTFVTMALALGASVKILVARLNGWTRWFAPGLLGFAAMGMLIAGIFPPDPTGTPLDAMTRIGKIHILGASLDFTPIAALIASIALARQAGWRGTERLLLAAALLTVAVMIAFIASMPADHIFGPDSNSALIGRMQWLSYFAWFAALTRVARRQ